ncbi:MAG: glucosaminidase domain-containing protein [Spirochaetaceae bacterium]|jgi:hypothetical protein|nr:glucosaminidase domain-containing protein [Spirochaetaceae bacterium]
MKRAFCFGSLFLIVFLFYSCKTPPKAPPPSVIIPQTILGSGKASRNVMAAFLTQANPSVNAKDALDFAALYIEEAGAEGVNHDVAFAQMCVETGFLNFGGLVTPDMHNYCGLGSIGPGTPGERFPSPRMGVRAQIQHLKAYATNAPLNKELADPRYHLVKRGSASSIDDLAGKWAADPDYAKKIKRVLTRLYTFRRNVSF